VYKGASPWKTTEAVRSLVFAAITPSVTLLSQEVERYPLEDVEQAVVHVKITF
jgi:hypothetical protein